jgi:hypothetical protein
MKEENGLLRHDICLKKKNLCFLNSKKKITCPKHHERKHSLFCTEIQ